MYVLKEILAEDYFTQMHMLLERDKPPLKQWNIFQKKLWSQLVFNKYVERNDAKAFYAFGKFVDMYYQRTGKMPSFYMVVANVVGAI